MEVVYLRDFDNNRVYINRKYRGRYEDKEYEMIYFDEGSMNSKVYHTKNYDEVKLEIGKVNFEILYDNKWLATHPNGLLAVTPPLGESIETVGSYAVDDDRRYYTAWHVGMIYLTSLHTVPNVPLKLYHKCPLKTVRFRPSICTPSAWLRKTNLYQLDYDVMEIIPSTYSLRLATPPGKLLGVISMSIVTKNGVVTGCSKIPGVRTRRNGRIETIGYSTGVTYGQVVSTRAESVVKLEENLFVLNKNLFTVTNETISGDSGGGCYLVT